MEMEMERLEGGGCGGGRKNRGAGLAGCGCFVRWVGRGGLDRACASLAARSCGVSKQATHGSGP